MNSSKPNGKHVEYIDKSTLKADYRLFCEDKICENLFIHAPGKFQEACDAFNGIFKLIAAAGGIVRNHQEEYLFIKRLGVWDLPKGKLDKIETPVDGALREVTEETGLKNLSVTKQLQSTFHIYNDRKGREILKETFWFEMICNHPQQLIPQLEEDITEVKWFNKNDLAVPMQNTYASLRQLLESYFNS